MSRQRFAAALAGALALAGCAAPKGGPAVAPLPATAVGLGATPAPAIAADWWKTLGDPQLDRLVADALAHAPTLDAAMARVRLAEAAIAGTRSALSPQLGLDASAEAQRMSGAYIIPPPYGGSVQWVGQAQANLGWTLDFWGRQADAIHQATAEAEAARIDAGAARLAIAATVAQTYVELARAERQTVIAAANAQQQREQLQMALLKRRSGLASDLDVRSAEALATAADQQALRAAEQRAAMVHALAQLAGRGADYHASIGPTALNFAATPPLPAALPADLLARRPDILAARARIEAATAGRQVAAKAYYPNINLMALAGFQALGLENIFSGRAGTFGAGAALHLPIFDGGRIRADHAAASAGLDAAIASYNGAVVGAVREAADALSAIGRLDADLAAQRRAEAALADVRRFSDSRKQAGLGSRIELIGADLRLLDARRQTANLEADLTIARIRLLAALGGGIVPDSRPVPAEARTLP